MPAATRSRSRRRRGWSTRSATTATSVEPGDRVLLIVENDLGVRALPARHGARAGLQGHRHLAGRRGAGARARVQAGGDHARHLPARHRRLARAGSAEERRRDAPHSGRVDLDRRGARPRARLRRACRSSPSRSRARRCSTRCCASSWRFIRPRGAQAARRRRADPATQDELVRQFDVATTYAILTARDRATALRAARASHRVDCIVLDADLAGAGRRRRWTRAPARIRRSAACRSSSTAAATAPKALDGWRRLAQEHDRARRPLARAPARPDEPLPAPRTSRSCRSAHRDGADDAARQSTRRSPGKQVLIVDDDMRNIFALTIAARGARHGRSSRPTTAATRSGYLQARAGHRHRADGHHDAGDGRHRHDARDPQAPGAARTCRSSR